MATVAQEPTRSATDSAQATQGTTQIVSFRLADEAFGVAITKVREIILMCDITQIPQTPHYVRGLINLRSTVIPVIDLRALFGLPEGEKAADSRIMVLQVGERIVGVTVDGVDQVLRISHDEIAPPPPAVAGLGNEYLDGLVKLEDQILILLDVDKILGKEEKVLDSAIAGA